MALLQPERNVVLTANGVEWHQLFLIRVPRTGEYELRCTGEGVRFGVATIYRLGSSPSSRGC